MPSPPEHDNDKQPDGGKRGLLAAGVVVAVMVIIVLLHLLGVLGPSTHG